MGHNDVVEWGVSAPEAREPDFDDHDGSKAVLDMEAKQLTSCEGSITASQLRDGLFRVDFRPESGFAAPTNQPRWWWVEPHATLTLGSCSRRHTW
jgi:hypothetical protein